MGLKKTPQINAASMADIAFIILCFFLMVTTMSSEYGMIRMLPPWTDSNDEQKEKIKERNIFVVNINMNNVVGVRGQPTDVGALREMAKDFFDLSKTGEHDPEKEQKELPLLGLTTVNSGAVISLQNDRGTSYKIYLQVQNELTAAIRELRDEFCMQRFGNKYDECNQEQQDVVGKEVFPMSISEAEPRDISGSR